MSATTTPAESTATAPATAPNDVSLWTPEGERQPSESEISRAREHTLSVGNKTEIGYDANTEWYDPNEATEERYKRLDRHNRDNHWEYREDVEIAKDYDRQIKLKSTLGIASQLGLSDFHKQVVLDRLFEIDGRRFGERNEAVAFCLCAIVVNEEAEARGGAEKVYHPTRNDANNDKWFVGMQNQLIEAFGPITKSRLQSIYAKLRQGRPPSRNDDETCQFRNDNSIVQRHPSYPPEGTLPHPTGVA